MPAIAQQPTILSNLNVTVTKLDQLNSRAEETNMCITPNGQTMFFMSDRGGQPWSVQSGEGSRMRYDGDIWRSTKTGDTWSPPRVMGPPVSSGNGEDEPNVLADGQTVIFQSWQDGWDYRGGPYFMSRMQGNSWSRPIGIGGGITRFFQEKFILYQSYGTDGVAISPDGNTFVMACGADYFGNMDLYMAVKNMGNQWSYPRKLNISTKKNERSVFFGADGKTLYFSSNGHGGHGGLDIFKTTLNPDGTHGAIVNLGPKFNTLKNDYGFIIAADGKEAYFVRNGDIYQGIIKDPPPELLAAQSGMVVGTILNAEGNPMAATLKLVDAATGSPQQITQADPKTGKYSFFVSDRTKKLKVECFTSKKRWGHKQAPFDAKSHYSEVVVDFRKPAVQTEAKPTPPVAVAEKTPEANTEPRNSTQGTTASLEQPKEPIVVHHQVTQYLFFPYNKTEISEAARFKLNQLALDMKAESKTTFLLSAYGDHQEGWVIDTKLSRQRAVNVARYLVAAGVPESQLVVEYYPQAFHENRGNQTLYPGIRKVEVSRLRTKLDPAKHNILDLSKLDIEVTGIRGVQEEGDMVRFRTLGESIHKDPRNAKYYVERGLLHVEHLDYDAALKDFDKARQLGVTPASAGNKSAFDAALASLNKVLALNGDEPHALMTRGEVKDFLGQRAEACADWNKAKALKPELLKNHAQLMCK